MGKIDAYRAARQGDTTSNGTRHVCVIKDAEGNCLEQSEDILRGGTNI